MIAYHILCHGNFKQVAMLVEALYDENDTFLIDIDAGQQPDTRPIRTLLRLPNVHSVEDSNIGWGGSGTLRKTLKGAFRLLELDSRWEYYIVLSGQDMPLQSNADIKKRLAQGAKHKRNFIRACQAPHRDLASIPIDNKGSKCQLWGDRGHTRVYAKPGTINPQTCMFARTLVDVAEIGEKGEVYVGLADPLLQRRREAFFSRFPYHTGANWFNLHRSLIEYMHSDPFTYELYDVIRGTFIPDEAYFQTYIMNTSFRASQSQDYARLILRPGPIPRVKVFDMQDWDTISNSRDMFGRKFDTNHDKQVIKQLLRQREAA